MSFQVSPGVNVSEIDLTGSIPAVSVSTGAIAGAFSWGPVEKIVPINNETALAARFGAPTDATANVFFTAASFLAYSGDLLVTRATGAGLLNSVAAANSGTSAGALIKNDETYFQTEYATGVATTAFAARFAGAKGNSLKVSICPSAGAFTGANINTLLAFTGTVTANANVPSNVIVTSGNTMSVIAPADVIQFASNNYVVATVNATAIVLATANTFVANVAATDIYEVEVGTGTPWVYASAFDNAPGTSPYTSNLGGSNDEMHIVVVDEDGLFTGTANTILERFPNVSKASDARTDDGSANFYKEVLFRKSQYVYWTGTNSVTNVTNWGTTAANTTFGANATIYTASFRSGADGTYVAANTIAAYNKFADPEFVDVSILMTADGNATVQGSVTTIAEARKDCIVTVSPSLAAAQDVTDPATAIKTYRDALTSSSYVIMDSGWKYMYDKYSDKYRWVPLNGDVAGVCARTDADRDPWFSPAGYQRGILKNVTRLAFNPNQQQRDILYKAGVNPVVSFPGEGTLLYGDKTMLARPSAFDRINVRRLFIVLEKAIARAAKRSLFEFNDEFTRAQFKSLVEPFLRTVQGRRGIYDFRVVCDETNNTPDIIDRNEFVGDIYIKPARSINFIQLNFVAVRTGVAFDEVVGKF